MAEFKLKEFSSSIRWWDGLWGGGHTIETDPSRSGWRCRPMGTGGVVLIGQQGQQGCASVRLMADGQVDVAIYDEARPEEVARAPREADAYLQVPSTPGWGLVVIAEIKKSRQ